MSGDTFSTYLAAGGAGLNPITRALCETWPVNVTTQQFGPSPAGPSAIAALIDAVAALEAAVIALQG